MIAYTCAKGLENIPVLMTGSTMAPLGQLHMGTRGWQISPLRKTFVIKEILGGEGSFPPTRSMAGACCWKGGQKRGVVREVATLAVQSWCGSSQRALAVTSMLAKPSRGARTGDLLF